MSSNVKTMVFIQYGKITINLFAQVKQFVDASVDHGKQIIFVMIIMFRTPSGTHCGYVFHTRSGTHCGYMFNMFVSRTKCYDENVTNECFCRLCIQLAFEWEFIFLL